MHMQPVAALASQAQCNVSCGARYIQLMHHNTRSYRRLYGKGDLRKAQGWMRNPFSFLFGQYALYLSEEVLQRPVAGGRRKNLR